MRVTTNCSSNTIGGGNVDNGNDDKTSIHHHIGGGGNTNFDSLSHVNVPGIFSINSSSCSSSSPVIQSSSTTGNLLLPDVSRIPITHNSNHHHSLHGIQTFPSINNIQHHQLLQQNNSHEQQECSVSSRNLVSCPTSGVQNNGITSAHPSSSSFCTAVALAAGSSQTSTTAVGVDGECNNITINTGTNPPGLISSDAATQQQQQQSHLSHPYNGIFLVDGLSQGIRIENNSSSNSLSSINQQHVNATSATLASNRCSTNFPNSSGTTTTTTNDPSLHTYGLPTPHPSPLQNSVIKSHLTSQAMSHHQHGQGSSSSSSSCPISGDIPPPPTNFTQNPLCIRIDSGTTMNYQQQQQHLNGNVNNINAYPGQFQPLSFPISTHLQQGGKSTGHGGESSQVFVEKNSGVISVGSNIDCSDTITSANVSNTPTLATNIVPKTNSVLLPVPSPPPPHQMMTIQSSSSPHSHLGSSSVAALSQTNPSTSMSLANNINSNHHLTSTNVSGIQHSDGMITVISSPESSPVARITTTTTTNLERTLISTEAQTDSTDLPQLQQQPGGSGLIAPPPPSRNNNREQRKRERRERRRGDRSQSHHHHTSGGGGAVYMGNNGSVPSTSTAGVHSQSHHRHHSHSHYNNNPNNANPPPSRNSANPTGLVHSNSSRNITNNIDNLNTDSPSNNHTNSQLENSTSQQDQQCDNNESTQAGETTGLPDLLNSHLPPPYSTLPQNCERRVGVGMPVLHSMPPPQMVSMPMVSSVQHGTPHGAMQIPVQLPLPPPPPPILVQTSGPGNCHGLPSPAQPAVRYHFPQNVRASRRSLRAPRGVAYASEEEPKSCCGMSTSQAVSIRWFIIVIAVIGICCTVAGTALGAAHSTGREHLTLSLLMIGVGVVLLTVSAVAWRLTANESGSSCRAMLGFARSASSRGDGGTEPNRRFAGRLAPSYGRPHHPYAAMMYPDFQYRPPPPSYQASMQEYRLRLLLLERSNPTIAAAASLSNPANLSHQPPPAYRPYNGTMRPPGNGRHDPDYSRPPSYRSRSSGGPGDNGLPHRPSLDPSAGHHLHHHQLQHHVMMDSPLHSRDPSLLSYLSQQSIADNVSVVSGHGNGSGAVVTVMQAVSVGMDLGLNVNMEMVHDAFHHHHHNNIDNDDDNKEILQSEPSDELGDGEKGVKGHTDGVVVSPADKNKVRIVQTTDSSQVIGGNVIVTVSGSNQTLWNQSFHHNQHHSQPHSNNNNHHHRGGEQSQNPNLSGSEVQILAHL